MTWDLELKTPRDPALISPNLKAWVWKMQIVVCNFGHMQQLLWTMLIPIFRVVIITSLDITLTMGVRVVKGESYKEKHVVATLEDCDRIVTLI